jgi:hypothetical protein
MRQLRPEMTLVRITLGVVGLLVAVTFGCHASSDGPHVPDPGAVVSKGHGLSTQVVDPGVARHVDTSRALISTSREVFDSFVRVLREEGVVVDGELTARGLEALEEDVVSGYLSVSERLAALDPASANHGRSGFTNDRQARASTRGRGRGANLVRESVDSLESSRRRPRPRGPAAAAGAL